MTYTDTLHLVFVRPLSIHALKILNLKFQLLLSEILGKDLWNLISMCVLQPSAVGFNLGDVEIIKNLPTEVGQLLTIHMTVKISKNWYNS